MPQETWSIRDEPLLEAIIELIDGGARHVRPDDLVERTGFDAETIRRGLIALAHEDPPFFEHTVNSSLVGEEIDVIRNPSGHARRTVKTWPTAETLADRLIAGLERAADETADDEEASRLRRTGQWFGAAGRDVLVNIISTAMTGG